MDFTLLLHALILGIVEGLTEFLPVSSTGHLILAGDLLGFNDERGKLFEIVIQTGAILAVCWEYRAKIGSVAAGLGSDPAARRFVINLAIAFLPLAILGLLFHKTIKAHLFQPIPVALAFIVGALVILWAERREHVIRVHSVDDMGWQDALKLGLAQAFALIPGTSRSGATIIGGLLFGLSRKAATEFSFFLAIPTLFAAGAYQLWKERHLLNGDDLGMWAVGFVSAFVSAFLCVRWLLRYISSHDFTAFAWYRIAFGLVVLGTAYTGMVDWTNPEAGVIIYLHGFRSSPLSNKAQRLQAHMASLGLAHRFWCEQLPPSPRAAIALAERRIAASDTPVTVVGSSLGGYYATHLAELHGLRAVLVNPAVVAHLSLAEFVGPQTNLYTGATFDFKPEYIDELRAIELARISRPQDFLLLVETGDEVLDYRQAVKKYAGCRQVVLQGGDHSFTRWDDYLDAILEFAGLTR